MQRVGASSLRLHARKRRIERRGVAVGRWMVGGAFEKAAESRGGEISEEADGENWKPRPDEKPFFIFREQRSRNESKKSGSAVFPPLSSKIDSFLKKRKKRFANSSSLSIENDRYRFKDRWIENGENLWEQKERKKGGRGIRQSAEGKVRYYGLTSWCIPVRLSVSDFSKTLHDSWKLVDE